MNTTESRREFEEWARDKMIPEMAMKYAQASWQAARERQNQELSAARKALLEISEMDYDEGDIWEQAEKIQAIAHNAYYHP
jgi:hypothetical protein